MSAVQEAQPTKIIIAREPAPERVPRERPFKPWEFIEPLVGPAIAIGVLVGVAFYKDELANIADNLIKQTGSKDLEELWDKFWHPDVEPLPPINLPDIPILGGGGGGISGGSTLWTSKAWSNGKSRTISNHREKDPSDGRLMISAGSGRKGTFPGNGTAKLQGDQSRFYILANNYNSAITMTAKAGSGLSNLSLKLRSRHNESGSCENRFGGYGVAFHFDSREIESKREDCHNTHTTIGSCNSPIKLNYNQDYQIGMTCQDSGSSVVMGAYVNGKRVCQFTDRSPKGYMRNKGSFNNKSYAWIRTNGGGSVTLKNVTLKEIGPLASSRLSQEIPYSYLQQQWQYYYPSREMAFIPRPKMMPRISVS